MITIDKSKLIEIIESYDVSKREGLLLLASAIHSSYSELFFKLSFSIPKESFRIFESFLKRRALGEPIAKIIQKKEFYGIEFKTTADTLDPRPETELIIDLFKEYYQNQNREAPLKILDLGSGTGCIGLTLLGLYQNATCTFVDISYKALDIAKYNSKILGLFDRSYFKISNWFRDINGNFDAIVSNPPYVSKSYPLDRETIFDPEIALFASNEGLASYEVILPESFGFLNDGGHLFLEIGFDQLEKVQNIKNKLRLHQIAKDLSGFDRALVFQKICGEQEH